MVRLVTHSANDVMAGLVPAIHVLQRDEKKDVYARDKPGHDENSKRSNT